MGALGNTKQADRSPIKGFQDHFHDFGVGHIGGATREADNKGMTTRFAVLEVDFIKPIFLHIYVVSATLHALSTMYIVQLYIVHIAVQNNHMKRRVI